MKLKIHSITGLLVAGLLVANSANAQWTRVGTNTYLTNTGDNVGIGTTTPAFKLDVVGTGNASMSFKSSTGNANVILDRFNTSSTAGVNYRTNGTPYWQTGMINTNNYVIRNQALAGTAIYCSYTNNWVGINTNSPDAALSVASTSLGGIATTGSFQIGGLATTNLVLDNNEVQARYNGGGSTLFLQYWGGDINACQSGGSASFYGPLNVSGVASLSSNLYVAGNVGIGTTTPTYQFDVVGSYSFGQIKGTSSWAGLIIDKATAADNGYVIHRTGGLDKWTEGTIGNDNFCLRNWPLGLNAFTVDAANNYIGIGTAAPAYLVDVQGNTAGSSYYNVNSTVNYVGSSDLRAFYGTSHPADGYGYGIQTYAGYYGGSFICNDGTYGFGVGAYGQATGTTGTQYGVYGYAGGGTTNYAVYASGLTYSTGGYSSSDAKLKKDIRVIDNALAKINQLQPRTYTFKTDEYKYMGLPSEQQYGFIAQELEQVFPEMVRDMQQPIDNDYKKNGMLTFKAINYTEMIPVLTQAVQEQQKQIEAKDAKIAEQQIQLDAVNARLDMIEKSLSQCCSNYSPNDKQSAGTATDAARLEQNQPNPFNQSSVIKFYVPSTFRTAQLVITDLSGVQLKSINIGQSGVGQVTINGFELASGSYMYSLIIDNVKVDTKKMELTK